MIDADIEMCIALTELFLCSQLTEGGFGRELCDEFEQDIRSRLLHARLQ